MSDAYTFTSKTPRFGLPNLFSGQAQKEITVNEALARLDALLHMRVLGVSNGPPTNPEEGDSWIVDSQPTGAWSGHPDVMAHYQSGTWLFTQPQEGMVLYDDDAGQFINYRGGWQRAANVSAATGGSVEDVESRAAIAAIIDVLKAAAIIPQT
ncbi:DUF2793 domain-containing protein [Aurantiacibacter gangjinensis]|uniref:Uncharacterized protein n=1 Tax=Aurantiacibacter gangjinensis TaxID=502682 RepID=A0A0G9MM36_9SPHN|nr:DUF2793 domain-containing protein [Aurantiacibacter gangjinensis]APE27648.1 hypothetical protein BMF35_a0819 [Aurantiacibacter gangjinensis]KLE31669.1 hypothetical protein AAW01_09095 [Aurantiacibacter gangjinensis]